MTMQATGLGWRAFAIEKSAAASRQANDNYEALR